MSARRTRVDFRLCDRSVDGHAWYPADDPTGWQPGRVFRLRRVSRCERCGTYRFLGLNAYGGVEARWYKYPDDWKDRWGVGAERPVGDDIRLKLMVDGLLTRKKRRTHTP